MLEGGEEVGEGESQSGRREMSAFFLRLPVLKFA